MTTTTVSAGTSGPNATAAPPPDRVTWPAERFYWAVLDVPGWSRTGPVPEGLRAEFEDEAPEAPEDLHAVCTPLGGGGGGRVLVCAARRESLAELPPATVSLLPAALPACIECFAEAGRACGALELLVGLFESRSRRRARAARHLASAAAVGLCALLTVVGLSRRTAHWDRVADAVADARTHLVREHVPATAHLPEALLAEVARLRQGHDGAARVRPAPDAALALAAVLRAWPADVSARTQSLTASGAAATISVNVEGDPAPFLRAMAAPEGWSKSEPRLNTSGGTTRIVLGLAADAKTTEEAHR